MAVAVSHKFGGGTPKPPCYASSLLSRFGIGDPQNIHLLLIPGTRESLI